MYRTIDPSDKDEKHKLNVLQENILELQKEFGIVLPDPLLVDSEVQVTSQHPVGACGLYDLYPGTYLGKEVWCKKLSYGDPQGKAMMVGEYATRGFPADLESTLEAQTGARHLEQTVEEGSRTTSTGRHPASGAALIRFLCTL